MDVLDSKLYSTGIEAALTPGQIVTSWCLVCLTGLTGLLVLLAILSLPGSRRDGLVSSRRRPAYHGGIARRVCRVCGCAELLDSVHQRRVHTGRHACREEGGKWIHLVAERRQRHLLGDRHRRRKSHEWVASGVDHVLIAAIIIDGNG